MELKEAIRVLEIEARCITNSMNKLNGEFVSSVDLVMACKGKVIVTGMGKSGQVGQKISSTLSSTGTPSLFLSPAEGMHGDLGAISSSDLVIAISNGGESAEMMPLINYCARKGIQLIAFTGNLESTLARAASHVIDISVEEEACPLGLAPTSSSTVTLALGDALAMTVLKKRGFNEEQYAEFHPGGSLGRKLLTRVKDVMHKGEALPFVGFETVMSEVIGLMTSKEVRGVAGVLDSEGALKGVITDGDIRRCLNEGQLSLLQKSAKDFMTVNPKTIDCGELAQKALFVMEQFSIQTLFVTEKPSNKPIGLLHLQDLLRANIR